MFCSVNEALNLLAANKVVEFWNIGLLLITGNAQEGQCFGFGVFFNSGIFTFYHETFLAWELNLNMNFTTVLCTIEAHSLKILYTESLASLYFDSDPTTHSEMLNFPLVEISWHSTFGAFQTFVLGTLSLYHNTVHYFNQSHQNWEAEYNWMQSSSAYMTKIKATPLFTG